MRISLEQALNILMDHVTHGKTERKTLEDCLGLDRKRTRLNSSHSGESRMPSSA